jgi:hypothetical protein
LKRLGWLAVLAAVLAVPVGLHAYLKFGVQVGNRVENVRWTSLPVRYFVTNRDVAGVTAPQLQAALDRAFSRWTAVPGTVLSNQFAGFTNAEPSLEDGASTIGFRLRADLDRTLGATRFTVREGTADILEADIFLNSSFSWSVADGGETGRFDVESIAVHEIGHMIGLAHSMIGETELVDAGRRRVLGKRAVMFPIAYPSGNVEDRTLEADDRAGAIDIYGAPELDRATGAISGRVTLNGAGLFGAHVTAFNPSTSETVASFSLNQQGDFVIASLVPGLYVVRVEPLDDADVDSFFGEDMAVNTGFAPAYFSKLVAVPAGGAAPTIEIKVRAK